MVAILDTDLVRLNNLIDETLTQMEDIAAEDERSDNLVSVLQELIRERQIYVESLINTAIDETYATALSEQLILTKRILQRSSKIMSHRQSLLKLKRTHKRQIKIYQNIDANR